MRLRDLFMSVLPLAAAALGAFAPDEAYSEFAARGGYAVKPDSSIELPEQIGLSAHTNFQFFVPNAGKAVEQFSREIVPEQSGGAPFAGYFYETPASLACVYSLVKSVSGCNPNTVTTNPTGGSRAIAIVDAYHYPTAMSDLAVFSSQFKLPAPTSANFQVVFASGGQPPVNADWNIEEALDIEWAHAMAPGANIYLVEARSSNFADLLTAVNVANQLVAAAGGGEVSMSWGGSEFWYEFLYDGYFTQANVVYFAAAGDSPGVIWPSTSPYVVSVGGTSISRNPNSGAFQTEVTWQLGGGGPSVYETRPSYQNGISATVGNQRGTPDVAADANPSSGVWVYVAPYWYIVGGTSVATPVWAGIINAAGHFYSSNPSEFTVLYTDYGTSDITSGTCGPNQAYSAGPGWDFCTGLGSPLIGRLMPPIFCCKDLNGDGYGDIVWRDNAGEVYGWLTNGLGIIAQGPVQTVGNDWQIAGIADFNGDGKADILWRNASGEVFIWLMNGLGIASQGSLGIVGNDWQIAGVGDFNGDGKADILWRNISTGGVYIWLMNGLGITSQGSLGIVGNDWQIAGVGDFNGDGKADILWRNASGEVYVWFMNGLAINSQGTLGVIGNDWQIAGVGDFNGDGRADILWRNISTGEVYVWLMNGLASNEGSLGVIGNDWQINGVGDMNGDGKADIIWRNLSTGDVYEWLMNGISIIGQGSYGTVGNDWSIE